MTDFRSDNTGRAAPEILDALIAANTGTALGYGADEWTARLQQRYSELFETAVRVFPVATGTAANALSLAALGPSWGLVYCSELAHINTSEANAAGFFGGGLKLAPVPGAFGRVDAEALSRLLAAILPGQIHRGVPVAVNLTQATDLGGVYSLDEVRAVSEVAKARGLKVHMDGARFANALVRMNASPAEITWKAGVDVLSFGATKAGALAAEAVVYFDKAMAANMGERRKRAGHLLSKHRFLSLQFDAFLKNDCWLRLARHANAMADRLAAGLAAVGRSPVWPVEANLVFIVLPKAVETRLKTAGARFYVRHSESLPDHIKLASDQCLIRLVTSFATRDDEVDRFVALAAKV